MSTSLAEQLRRLTVPQTLGLVDSKKRASILFDPKEAANKDRQTIFDLGHKGLMDLIQMNPVFGQFEKTLFDIASLRVERSVEAAEVNKLIDKNIKTFFYHLSPYFMLQPAHLCLEWLIRRFHIHEYNKTELFELILPYHETKIFVKCVQLLNLKSPNDPWIWLEPIQKPGVPLSKSAIFNRASNDSYFLNFVCDTTKNAIKELDTRANTLQTLINFYYTTVIGGLEHAKNITESHLLNILPSVLKGLSSNIIDFTAAALMITMQLCCKIKLSRKLIDKLIEKICAIDYPTMQTDVILALIVIYQRQLEIINDFPEEHLSQFVSKKWVLQTISIISDESVTVSFLCDPLVGSCLRSIEAKNEGWNECKTFLESLLKEVKFKDTNVDSLIRTVLHNYQQTKPLKKVLLENNVIEIDCDNENDVETDNDMKMWYSQYLQELEKQYPIQFDNIIKQVLQEDSSISEAQKQAIKAILAFRLKSTFLKGNTSIYENLYHQNVRNRLEGVKFLVENLRSLNLSEDSKNLLKDSLKDRLNDEDQSIVTEVLKISSENFVKMYGNEEFVNKLILILCRSQSNPDWKNVIPAVLNHLTKKEVYNGYDFNRIFLAIIPFLLPISNAELENTKIIFSSDFARELEILRIIVTNVSKFSKHTEIATEVVRVLNNTKELPKSEEFLKSFTNINNDYFVEAFNFSCFLILLEISFAKNTDAGHGLEIIKLLLKLKDKFNFVCLGYNDNWIMAIRQNKVPLSVFLKLLKTIIKSKPFENLQDFNIKSQSLGAYLEIFEFLLKNAFTNTKTDEKCEYTETVKDILDFHFASIEEKLKFLANFFIAERVPNSEIFMELQIRSMRLFYFFVKSNKQSYKIDKLVFTKILISLSSEIQTKRECCLMVLKTLLKCDVFDKKLKALAIKILEHSEEIKMHQEHLALVLSLIMSHGSKSSEDNEYTGFVLKLLLDVIDDNAVENYIKANLLAVFKHVTSVKILKRSLLLGLEILRSYETMKDEDNFILNPPEGEIIESIALRYDEKTIKLLLEDPSFWEFLEKCLQLHEILVNKNEKFVSIASFIMDVFDEQTYNEMAEKFKTQFLSLIINAATFNERDNTFSSNVKKLMKRIQIDGKHILPILDRMKEICNTSTSTVKKELKTVAPDPQILNSSEWKNGITLLEFLQNKKKIENYKILIPALFDILKKCVEYEEQFNLEYVNQLILSCLLLLCQKVADLPPTQRDLPESVFKVEIVVQCIRGTQNSQTHHHALLLLSYCATIIPQKVLHNMMSIFTFIGSSVVRHDDAFSFQIISNIIESVIPTLIQANGRQNQYFDDDLVIPVLKVFADIILDVPEHRRLLLYSKLIRTLGASKYLWMFLCVLFESHVVHSEKKKKESHPVSGHHKVSGSGFNELPKRIEIALQIVKDFEPSVTIETCTELFGYLKTLPLDKRDDQENMQIDITDVTLFNVDAHSSKHLRHYKYTILQFINTFLSSTEFINQIVLIEDNEMNIMRPYYQNFIIKILSYIPHIIKAIEMTKDSNQVKFWKVLLHHCYDILESAISFLSPDMLLIVVHRLMQHQLPAVRKKVIEILNNKLMHKVDYFENCNKDNMLNLLDPLMEICDSILSEEKLMENATINEIIYIQQTALIAIKILSKLLAVNHPEKFKEVLVKLTKIIKKKRNVPKILLATVALTITEIASNLRAHSIVHLPKFMPLLIRLLEDQSEILKSQPPDNVCIAAITGMQKILEVLPLFLGPYVVEILVALIKIWIRILVYQEQESKTNVAISKLISIWTKIANTIPLRILVPNCDKTYTKLLEENELFGVGYLMKLLKESIGNSTGNDIESMQLEITSLFLNTLEFRVKFVDTIDTKEIEECIVEAFVSLILKLSESSFRPLYHKVYDWALRDKASKEKSITYFFLSSRIAESLQSLFVLFASDFIQKAAELLDKCNSAKSEKLYFTKSSNKNVLLIEYILKTFYHVFLYDSKGFINPSRFDIIMQPIVDQLENPLILTNEPLKELLLSTMSQLAVAVSNDTLWKQLNYQVLLKTRSNEPDIRILSFNCCVEIARKLGENFSTLLPETIPFVAELFEDEVQHVENHAKKGVHELEKILGESLQKYF